jgi:predicted transcriptional regulator
MQIQFPPELEGRLNQMALERGQNRESLVFEAVEQFIGYDEWFACEVSKGLADADEGKLIEHSDVLAMVEHHFSGLSR